MYRELLSKINERQLSHLGTGINGLPPPIVLPHPDRNNYQFITIWTLEDWAKAKKRNDDASIQKKKKGHSTKNMDFTSTRESMAYIQDKLGNPVTEAQAQE